MISFPFPVSFSDGFSISRTSLTGNTAGQKEPRPDTCEKANIYLHMTLASLRLVSAYRIEDFGVCVLCAGV